MEERQTKQLAAQGIDVGDVAKRAAAHNTSLKNVANYYEPTWRDIRDHLGPRTARFEGEQPNQHDRQDNKIIDSKPRMAVRTLPAGMQSGVTSPMRPWFRLSLADRDLAEFRTVKQWLSVTEGVLRETFARSNIYDALQVGYGSLGLYGTAAIGIRAHPERVIHAVNFPTGTYRLGTDEFNNVNACYRDVFMTTEQMMSMFGKNVPDNIRLEYDNGNYYTMHCVLQCIKKNPYYIRGHKLAIHKRYANIFLFNGDQGGSVLSYGGSDFFPVLAPRWDILGDDTYGMGCGELALGDAKQVQLLERKKLLGIDRNADPHMVADASLRNARSNNLPGRTTYVSGLITGKDGYKPSYVPNPYINEFREEIMRVEANIEEAFYKNLFLMVTEIGDQPNITATQINQMREEKLMMLGPVLGRINTEQNDALIDITFDELYRRGRIPPPPEEISEMPLKVEYISILAQAQKAIGLGNIERFCINFVGGLAQASGDPTVWDNVNLDETIQEYADGSGTPPSIINDPESVQAKRQQRAQQQQMEQGMAMADMGADIAQKASSIDPNGAGRLLEAMQVVGG